MKPAIAMEASRSQTVRRNLRRLNYIICICLALPFSALAQKTAPAVLPPDAQEAIKKGVLAARQQDYLLASRFFQDARKIAPQAPEIYYDLGLAESKLPGRELRAICWFEAYLTARPKASNMAAVREQIDVLDVKSRSNFARVIMSMQDAAGQRVNKDPSPSLNFGLVARLWTKSGDITAALKTVDLISDADYKTQVLRIIAAAQAEAGDSVGAKATLAFALRAANLIQNASTKSGELGDIAVAQAKSGDIALAQSTADLIQDAFSKGVAEKSVAEAQVRSGDNPAALKTTELIQNAILKSQAQIGIAEAQTKARDKAGARATLAFALQSADLIQEESWKIDALTSIAEAQAKAGDVTGAKATSAFALKIAELIHDADSKASKQQAIAEAQAKVGDIASAKTTFALALQSADLIQDEYSKPAIQAAIAKAQAESGDLASAQKAVDLIPDGKQKSNGQAAIAEAQAKAGNIVGAQKTVELIKDEFWKSRARSAIVAAQAKAGDFAGAQKTAGLIPEKLGVGLPDGYWKGEAQRSIATAQAHSAVPVIVLSDWLTKLDNSNPNSECPLDTDAFLDLGAFLLKAIPPSDDPQMLQSEFQAAAEVLVKAQDVIHGMMKQQLFHKGSVAPRVKLRAG